MPGKAQSSSRCSAPHVGRQQQALHGLAVLEVGLDDLVDVGFVHEGVPGAFGVDHGHGTARAAVQAAGLVHAHLPLAGQAQLLDLLLAVVKARLGAVQRTAVLAVGPLVEAKEDRSEEHTSELQSPCNLVCRLLLEKKKNNTTCLRPVPQHPNTTSTD